MGYSGSLSRILFWNCRGLGSPKAIRSLTDLVRQHFTNIIFLCATKRWESKMRKV